MTKFVKHTNLLKPKMLLLVYLFDKNAYFVCTKREFLISVHTLVHKNFLEHFYGIARIALDFNSFY